MKKLGNSSDGVLSARRLTGCNVQVYSEVNNTQFLSACMSVPGFKRLFLLVPDRLRPLAARFADVAIGLKFFHFSLNVRNLEVAKHVA